MFERKQRRRAGHSQLHRVSCGEALEDRCVLNIAPVAVADEFSVGANLLLSGNVTSNDSDADGDALVASLVSSPREGTLSFLPSGEFTYFPHPGFVGVDRFQYRVSDGVDSSPAVTVTVQTYAAPTGAVRFVSASGGSFLNPLNWSPAGVPGAGASARFDLPSTYTVGFPGNAATDRMSIVRGDVTFDLGGHSYEVFLPLSVGSSGVTTHWTISNGSFKTYLADVGGRGNVHITVGNSALFDTYGADVDFGADGTLLNQGITQFRGSGVFTLSGHGSVDNRGTIGVGANSGGMALDMSGQSRFTNRGQLEFGSGVFNLRDEAYLENLSEMEVGVVGIADFQLGGHAQLVNSGLLRAGGAEGRVNLVLNGESWLINQGTILVGQDNASGALRVLDETRLTNAGEVIASELFVRGVVEMLPGSALRAQRSPTDRAELNIQDDGLLSGSGVLSGIVTNDANVATTLDANPLSIQGDYLQRASGTLSLNIPDAAQASVNGVIVSGQARVAGAIRIQLPSDYAPTSSQAFVLMSAERMEGELSSISLDVSGPATELVYELRVQGEKLVLVVSAATAEFDLATLMRRVDPAMTGALLGKITGELRDSADVDRFTIQVEAGQLVSVAARGEGTLRASIKLVSPTGVKIAEAFPSSAGGLASINPTRTNVPGKYVIEVTSADGQLGDYTVDVTLNAVVERESLGENPNDSRQNAQDVLDAFQTFSGAAATRATILSLPPSDDNGRQVVYLADMDSNPGWTLSGSWAYGRPLGQGGRENNPDPTSGYTGANVVGTNLAGNYPAGRPAMDYATTPAINLSNFVGTRLTFSRWLNLDYPPDSARIEVSNDGVNFATLWASPDNTVVERGWRFEEYDISSIADNQATVYVRWGLSAASSFGMEAGWNLDDVAVTGIRMPTGGDDWYRFSLADGESLSAAVTTDSGASLGLELFDAQGTRLAGGISSTEFHSLLAGYVDVTSNGQSDDYYIRVRATSGGGYALLLARGTTLDGEPNSSTMEAQNIDPSSVVMGELVDRPRNVYRYDDGGSELSTRLPAGGDLMWMTSFTATPGQNVISAISVAWSSFVDAGSPATVLLYEDPTDDGNPVDAVLLTTAETIVTVPGTDTLVDVPIPPTRVSGEFFVASLFRNQQPYESVAPIDTNLRLRRSWWVGSFDEPIDLQELNNNFYQPRIQTSGTWLLGAVADGGDLMEDWYRFHVNAGDSLNIETETPGAALLLPDNSLDPAIALYGPTGDLLALEHDNGADGRNARIQYVAEVSGSYRVRLFRDSATEGSYALRIGGSSAGYAGPEVLATEPSFPAVVSAFPEQVTLRFSQPLPRGSANAADLVVGGRPALSVSQLNPSTYRFQLDPSANFGEGLYEVQLPAGAVLDSRGVPNSAWSSTFSVDLTAPRVVTTSLPDGGTFAAGYWRFEATFDEALREDLIALEGVRLVGRLSGSHIPASLRYDPTTRALVVEYVGLPDDIYDLTLDADYFQDEAGNGLAEGDFSRRLFGDVIVAPLAEALQPLAPLGVRALEARLTAGVFGDDVSDRYRIELISGQTLSTLLTPLSPMPVRIRLLDANGVLLTEHSGTSSWLGDQHVDSDGTYFLEVSMLGGGQGWYEMVVTVDSSLELEHVTGINNGSMATAEPVGGRMLLNEHANRSAARGELRAGDVDWYSFDVAAGESVRVLVDAAERKNLSLEVRNETGALIAMGAGAVNYALGTAAFTPSGSNGELKHYFARISGGFPTDYVVAVYRNGVFDTEGNNTAATAQAIGTSTVVSGHLAMPDASAPSPASMASPSVITAERVEAVASAEPSIRFVDGRLLVRFVAGASEPMINAFLNEKRAVRERELFEGLFAVHVTSSEADMAALANEWTRHPMVEYAEPDYITRIESLTPNDHLFPRDFGLHNVGQIGATPDADIDAPEAWSVATGSRDVVVAVVDTGIDYSHPDLAENMWVNPGEIAGDGVDNDANGYVDDIYGIDTVHGDSDPMDDAGHGTHVAGIIGAVGDNGIGVAGVNWQVRMMSLKHSSADGDISASGTVEAYRYLLKMKTQFAVPIVAANNSWGGGPASLAVRDAMSAAINAGVVLVMSAGNNAADNDATPRFPSGYPLDGIIVVAATDKNDRLASFSNYGADSVDLGAPGTSILSTYLNDSYNFLSGTSMAAPHVTGAVALLRSINPGASVAETKAAILHGVDRLPTLEGKVVTSGRLNLARSVALFSDDYFKLELGAGEFLAVTGRAPSLGGGFNTLQLALELYDSQGRLLASGQELDSGAAWLGFRAPAFGQYKLRVTSAPGTRGDYQLEIERGATPSIPGDTNGDGAVNLVDLNNVRNNFGGTGLGDVTGDALVGLNDLNEVRNAFGESVLDLYFAELARQHNKLRPTLPNGRERSTDPRRSSTTEAAKLRYSASAIPSSDGQQFADGKDAEDWVFATYALGARKQTGPSRTIGFKKDDCMQ